MNISELLKSAAIVDDLRCTEKNDILAELTDAIMGVEEGLDRNEVIRVLQERENLGSTGIGDSVAIPHGKLKNIDRLLLSFGRSRAGVDFDSMDGKPAHLFFLLIAPEESVGVHLKTLARISKLLKDPAVRQKLLDAEGCDGIYRVICEEEGKL